MSGQLRKLRISRIGPTNKVIRMHTGLCRLEAGPKQGQLMGDLNWAYSMSGQLRKPRFPELVRISRIGPTNKVINMHTGLCRVEAGPKQGQLMGDLNWAYSMSGQLRKLRIFRIGPTNKVIRMHTGLSRLDAGYRFPWVLNQLLIVIHFHIRLYWLDAGPHQCY